MRKIKVYFFLSCYLDKLNEKKKLTQSQKSFICVCSNTPLINGRFRTEITASLSVSTESKPFYTVCVIFRYGLIKYFVLLGRRTTLPPKWRARPWAPSHYASHSSSRASSPQPTCASTPRARLNPSSSRSSGEATEITHKKSFLWINIYCFICSCFFYV